MSGRMPFLVGNGWKVKFWKDKWFGNASLGSSFLPLFTLASSKDVWVADVWDSSVPRGGAGGFVGALVSLDPSMIGWLEVWRGFSHAWIEGA